MTRLVLSVFALAFAVSFSACEGHSVAALPPHYQHKLHHGADEAHSKSGEKHGELLKDPNLKHKEAGAPAPAHP